MPNPSGSVRPERASATPEPLEAHDEAGAGLDVVLGPSGDEVVGLDVVDDLETNAERPKVELDAGPETEVEVGVGLLLAGPGDPTHPDQQDGSDVALEKVEGEAGAIVVRDHRLSGPAEGEGRRDRRA